jgi:Rieske Fe-S protein
VADDERAGGKHGRRGALGQLIVLGGAAFGCALAAPAAVFVVAPVKRGAGDARWVKTVRLASLGEGEPRKVAIVADEHDAYMVARAVDLGAVWLVRRGASVMALSVVCPHLGCSVNADGAGFGCPCHTSAFGPDGKRVAGPSPRDMDGLETKIEDGFVMVAFRKYRIGIAEREPIG